MRKAERYQWSSARCHVEKTSDPVISGDCYLVKEIRDWPVYLRETGDSSIVDELRGNTKTGRPCGDQAFMGKMERLLERRLGALPRGRPSKKAK
ncbi:MAG: hypothetical protein M0Z75_01095 [Nitrospiraceae bacterium]|nr:hypothetical protein [Nitrospiraceae bacterium]